MGEQEWKRGSQDGGGGGGVGGGKGGGGVSLRHDFKDILLRMIVKHCVKITGTNMVDRSYLYVYPAGVATE
ncbi:unnamed protein product, partial [Candidula unifasciata]